MKVIKCGDKEIGKQKTDRWHKMQTNFRKFHLSIKLILALQTPHHSISVIFAAGSFLANPEYKYGIIRLSGSSILIKRSKGLETPYAECLRASPSLALSVFLSLIISGCPSISVAYSLFSGSRWENNWWWQSGRITATARTKVKGKNTNSGERKTSQAGEWEIVSYCGPVGLVEELGILLWKLPYHHSWWYFLSCQAERELEVG